MVTSEIEPRLSSAIIVLMSVYFTYNLQYATDTQLVMSYLQENFQHNPTGKMLMAYTNIISTTSCIKRKLDESQDPDQSVDPDDTQDQWCFEEWK